MTINEEPILDLPMDLKQLVELKLIVPIRQTKDGKIIEYRFTHLARVLLSRCQ